MRHFFTVMAVSTVTTIGAVGWTDEAEPPIDSRMEEKNSHEEVGETEQALNTECARACNEVLKVGLQRCVACLAACP